MKRTLGAALIPGATGSSTFLVRFAVLQQIPVGSL